MSESIITYERIYELLRKEKYEPEIQKLPESFYDDVIEYLKEKQALVSNQKAQDSIFSQETEKTEKQIQNIKKILKELYERRENKILQLAIFSSRANTTIDTSNLLPEEENFYNAIREQLVVHRKGILENLTNLKYPKIDQPKGIKAEKQKTTKLVRFLTPVPKFMGEDLNIYGPFSEEDIGNLPLGTANLLIKKKRAQEIKE